MSLNSTRIFPVSMVWKRLYIFIFNILIPCKKPYDHIGIQQRYHAFHPSTNPIFVASLMSSFPASFFWSYSLKRNPFRLDNRLKGFYYGLFLTCAGTCRSWITFSLLLLSSARSRGRRSSGSSEGRWEPGRRERCGPGGHHTVCTALRYGACRS